MTHWLCIEVHFLAGYYHGCSDEGRDHQWPPNPHRLFQALVAAGNLGFRRMEFSEAKKQALYWLERRAAPEIVAPETHRGNVVRLYVPNNDLDKVARAWAKNAKPEKFPNELRTDKNLRPHYLCGDTTARFLWPITGDEWEIAKPHAELLCAEARHLHSLGLGIDLVIGNGRVFQDDEKRSLVGNVWMPDAGGIGWRVTIEGSLDELVARYREQRMRVRIAGGRGTDRWVAPLAPPTSFREVSYRRRAVGRTRAVHLFGLVDENGRYRSFDPRDVTIVAAWLRHAAHESARRMKLDQEFTDRFVCGHAADVAGRNDRFSYVPLPTIPFKGRDGRIRRVLLVEPFDGGGKKAEVVARRLAGASLIAEGTGDVMADLRAIGRPSLNCNHRFDDVIRRYLDQSRRWGSVTPVILPGQDDRRSHKAHGLVLKALAQAGYTTPVAEIHLQSEPVFPGSEMAHGYRVPVYLKAFPRTHAIITFAQPVPGPIAIGSGRHVGLGVCASLHN